MQAGQMRRKGKKGPGFRGLFHSPSRWPVLLLVNAPRCGLNIWPWVKKTVRHHMIFPDAH
jgi:hypothetical protein